MTPMPTKSTHSTESTVSRELRKLCPNLHRHVRLALAHEQRDALCLTVVHACAAYLSETPLQHRGARHVCQQCAKTQQRSQFVTASTQGYG